MQDAVDAGVRAYVGHISAEIHAALQSLEAEFINVEKSWQGAAADEFGEQRVQVQREGITILGEDYDGDRNGSALGGLVERLAAALAP